MAIYHLHCDIIGRSGGRSATAASAYRATEKIEDRTTGETFDYRKKEKALYTEILTNGDVPEWATDRAELWNSCEEKENRKNSQFCRSFDGALPKEFDLETNIRLSKQFAEIFTKRGTPADLAIHAPHKDKNGKSNDNTHFHLLVATRKMNKDGWTEKDREANDKDFLKEVRKSWADIVNAEFERRGMSERIDERTLEEQGIDREPQQHQGVTATAMERKGKTPDRKKYKSQEEERQEIIVTDKELDLTNDEEFLKLVAERECILAEERQKKWQENQEKKRQENLVISADPENPEPQKRQTETDPNRQAERNELLKWFDRIEKMTPQQWREFKKNYDQKGYVENAYGEYTQTLHKAVVQSQEMWVEKNIVSVTDYFRKERHEKVTAYNSFTASNKRPWQDAKSEKKFLLGTNWYCSDGENFGDDPINARLHQQELRREYDKKFLPLESSAKLAIKEHEDCLKKDYAQIRINIINHHKTLFEKMRDGAVKLYKESPIFAPVRAMVGAFKKLLPQKDRELELYRQEQKRQRGQNQDQDKGYYHGF